MEGGIRFGLGATIATTKTVLHADRWAGAAGRLPGRRLRTRCADRCRRTSESSWPTSSWRPRCPITAFAISGFISCAGHETSKTAARAQYFGLIVTFGLVWAVLAVLAAPRRMVDVAGSCRYGRSRASQSAVVVGRGVLADPQVLRDLWLLPLRDFIALAIWLSATLAMRWNGAACAFGCATGNSSGCSLPALAEKSRPTPTAGIQCYSVRGALRFQRETLGSALRRLEH